MGGTFDPPHLGHLAAASAAYDQLDLDAVLLVPAGEPWQKAAQAVTSAAHRLAMVRLVAAEDPRFVVSDVDVVRPGPSYTVETLADLRALHPDSELHLIVGADLVAGLPGWHRAEDLVAGVDGLAVVVRPGHPRAHPGPPVGEVTWIETPGVDISATQCRERFAANLPNRYLVPDSVIAYVHAHALYGGVA